MKDLTKTSFKAQLLMQSVSDWVQFLYLSLNLNNSFKSDCYGWGSLIVVFHLKAIYEASCCDKTSDADV